MLKNANCNSLKAKWMFPNILFNSLNSRDIQFTITETNYMNKEKQKTLTVEMLQLVFYKSATILLLQLNCKCFQAVEFVIKNTFNVYGLDLYIQHWFKSLPKKKTTKKPRLKFAILLWEKETSNCNQ